MTRLYALVTSLFVRDEEGQDRGRFIEGLVTRGFAATQIIVVHARQIVVDKRVGVDAFNSTGERHGGGVGAQGLQRRADGTARHRAVAVG